MPAIASEITARRSTGSSIPTGSGAHIAAMRLPSAPRSLGSRTETGTSAFSTSSSVSNSCRRM